MVYSDLTDEQLADRAFDLAETGRHRDAIVLYSELLVRRPLSEIYHQRGLSYLQCGDLDRALSDFTSAIESNEHDADSHLNRGNVQLRLKNYDDAIADYTRAIELNPECAYAFNGRGYAYWRLGREDQASSDFWDAVGLNGQYGSPLFNLALVCFERQQYATALQWLDRAEVLLRHDPEVAKLRRKIQRAQATERTD